MRTWLAACLIAQGVLASPAVAQTPAPRQRHRIEASIGGLWIGGAPLGSSDADLRANQVPASPFRLFSTDSDTAASGGVDLRAAYWLTQSLAVEVGFTRSQPQLETRISADAESAPALTVAESLDQYFIDVSAIWALERLRIGRRTVPFVSGGAGYLRQLHEGRTLVETGQVFHVGGGVRHQLFESPRWISAVGVRVDGRLYVLVDGVEFEERARRHGAVTGALYVTF